jgi:hypothetical protein
MGKTEEDEAYVFQLALNRLHGSCLPDSRRNGFPDRGPSGDPARSTSWAPLIHRIRTIWGLSFNPTESKAPLTGLTGFTSLEIRALWIEQSLENLSLWCLLLRALSLIRGRPFLRQ